MAQIEVNLRDVYRVVRKRKWVILLAPILMGFSTFYMTEVPPPVYNSEALVRVSKSSTVAGMMTDIVSYGSYDNMATQIMVVTSRPVLEDVARRLQMVKPGEDTQSAFDELRGRISVEQRNGSDILAIMATGPSARQTIDLANTAVEAYIQRYNFDRDKRMTDAYEYLRKRLDESTSELAEAEKSLGDFKREQALSLALNVNSGLDLEEKSNQYRQKLDDLRATLATVTPIQQQKDYDSLLQVSLVLDDGIARAIADDVVRKAGSWTELRNKKNDLLRFQTDAAPAVVSATNALNSEQQRIDVQLTSLARRLNTVIANYEKLQSNVEKQQEAFLRQPEIQSQLEKLTTLAKEKNDTTTLLRKQFQDVELQQKEKIDELSIVESAHSARTVPQPGRYYKALIGVLIGILIGAMFAFVLESMDTSLGTIEDVEQHIGSTVLGIIPHLEKEDVKERMNKDRVKALSPEDVDRFARLVTHFDPKSIGSEAFRTLRTNVSSVLAKTNGKVVMISSSLVEEGKTTTCVNLATAFAQSGKKTLLIDADLRRPTIDKIFGIERSPGLTDILLGTREARECFRRIDDLMVGKFGLKLAQTTPGLEYLHILPAGLIADRPTELLSTPALDRLLIEARQNFDIVIVDAAPILPVADGFVLAPKVDAIILTYQVGRVARDVLKRTKLRVQNVDGNVIGIILNDIQSEIGYRHADFSYYNYRYDVDMGTTRPVLGRFRDILRMGRRPARPAKPKSEPKKTQDKSSAPSGASQEVRDIMSITDDDQD